MKVEYIEHDDGWYWVAHGFRALTTSGQFYTRRRDAVRGFRRFCAAIKGVK